MEARDKGLLPETRPPQARADAEDLLALLIDQVVDYAIFVLSPSGAIASWNPGAERIKGYAPEEIIGQSYAVFFTEEDKLRGKPNQILSHASTHGRFQEEGWRVRKDGSRFWASAVITALRDRAGAIRGFAKITRDLSERRQAEEQARLAAEERAATRQAELDQQEIQGSRDQLDLILRSIAEGVTAQAPDGRLIFANDAAARLCGFESAEAMLATPPKQIVSRFDVYAEDGTPFPLAELPGQIALRGSASSAVLRFRAKPTGEDRWSFVSGAPVVGRDGNVVLSVTVFREFTQRRRTEQAWQFLSTASALLGSSLDHEATLRQVTDLAVPQIADWCSVDILMADGSLDQLAVAHVDPAKRELAREWRRRWPPRQDSTSYQVARSGVPQLLPEITSEMLEAAIPDGEQRLVVRQLGLRSAMVVPLIVGQQPFGVVSFVSAESGRRYTEEDLILATETARRASLAVENARAYSEARNAVQARDNFLAIASHELRTPLSSLTILMTSLVRAAKQDRLLQLGAEALRERMIRAERQTRQLARLVDRLLDVGRLTTRDLQLDRERTDLAEIAHDVISRYEEAAAEAGTRIELTVQGSTEGVWDRSRLDQVVSNLLANAVKYGGGTPISLSISSEASVGVRLVVRDEGPGIAIEHQERIFGQFERAAPSQNLTGMGLGLWLVRRIVIAHGGTVTLESAPGQGAVFSVILPTSPDAATPAVESRR